MKRLIEAGFLIVMLFSGRAHAMLAEVSTKELMEETDYVVVASLSNVKEWTKNGVDYGRGTLVISEFLSERRPDRREIVLAWQNPSELVCPRTSHADTKGTEFIWLLQKGKDGLVNADYPGRILSLKDKNKVQKLVRKHHK